MPRQATHIAVFKAIPSLATWSVPCPEWTARITVLRAVGLGVEGAGLEATEVFVMHNLL